MHLRFYPGRPLPLVSVLLLALSLLLPLPRLPAQGEDGPGVAPTTGVKLKPKMVMIKMADGFDYAVGAPNGDGYYRFRGFRPHGHLGEDWNGNGGGDTDLGDPIYAIANGVVVFARDARMGWGNVIIVRHVFQDNDGLIRQVDSLYGHLDEVLVLEGRTVKKGQKIATMGSNKGMYAVHLHLEIRKNITMGMRRSAFSPDFTNFYSPNDFIQQHRKLRIPKTQYAVDVNTYDDGRTFLPPSPGLGRYQKAMDDARKNEPPARSPATDDEAERRRRRDFFQRSDEQ